MDGPYTKFFKYMKNITYACLEHKSIPLKKQAWTIWFHLAPSICLATGAILSFNLSQAILAACKIEKNTECTKIDKKLFNLVCSLSQKGLEFNIFFVFITKKGGRKNVTNMLM